MDFGLGASKTAQFGAHAYLHKMCNVFFRESRMPDFHESVRKRAYLFGITLSFIFC